MKNCVSKWACLECGKLVFTLHPMLLKVVYFDEDLTSKCCLQGLKNEHFGGGSADARWALGFNPQAMRVPPPPVQIGLGLKLLKVVNFDEDIPSKCCLRVEKNEHYGGGREDAMWVLGSTHQLYARRRPSAQIGLGPMLPYFMPHNCKVQFRCP